MNKNVLVKIRGLQYTLADDGESDEDGVEVISSGKYGIVSGKECIVYEEAIEDGSGVQKNVIKIYDDCVEISRKGTIMGNITFIKDKRTVSVYGTEVGYISMGIYTSEFSIIRSDNNILIKLGYALDLNDNYVSDNKVEIEIEGKV